MSPRTGSTIFGVPTSRRASLADSYNGEIYEADAARFIPVESARNWPLRAQVRSILRNGVARRTLHVTVLFGIVTIIYQGISLIPSFGGIEYLARSDVTSRQTVAYAFLQECANHKLYNLPLGPDCLKYLAMTPKAPPDIDKWMVDPPPSIPMKIRRAAREIILAARKIVTYEVEVRELTEPHYDAPFRGILVGNELMLSATLLASIYIFHPHLRRAASRLDSWIIGEIYLRWRNTVEVMRHFLRMSMVSFCLFTWFYLLGELFYVPTGWAATSEFLDTCKILEDNELPLGPDCSKYLKMDLTPEPFDYSRNLSLIFHVIAILSIGISVLFVTLRADQTNIAKSDGVSARMLARGLDKYPRSFGTRSGERSTSSETRKIEETV